MDARHQLTPEEFTSICASYACKPLSQSFESKAHSTFLLELRNNPEAQLKKMLEKAQEIIETYEYSHPIYQDKVTRNCLLDLEHTINHQKSLNLKQENDVERKRTALVSCIKLFICFKVISDTCHNNNSDLYKAINSFFEYLTVNKEYIDERIILRFNKRPFEDALHKYEKIKYEKALKKFRKALKKYGFNDSNIHPLEILKSNGIAINFCSLVLNTATQRLKDPTNTFHEMRLTNLQNFIRKEQPSVIIKYLPTILKFVGTIVAIVGLALLLAPPPLITAIELAAQIPVSTTIATAAASGGTATLLASGLFPSSKKYSDASKTIENTNNFITDIKNSR